jgi:hypothetical protein
VHRLSSSKGDKVRYAPTLRILLGVLPLLVLGCSKNTPSSGAGTGGTTVREVPNPDACSTPQEGCTCDDENEVVECGIPRKSEGYTSCTMGERVCSGGVWGPCEGETVVKLPDPEPGQQAQALGVSKACLDNPCDPYCQVVVDDSSSLMVGSGLDSSNGLTLKAVPPMNMGIQCTSITVTPATQTLTVTAINSTSGLLGEYFNYLNTGVTQIPPATVVAGSRIDSTVGFDWGSGAPGVAGVGADSFSVRWSGKVVPRSTESYTFYTTTDDGVRLWINGSLLIDKWVNQGPTEYQTATVAMTAGTPVDIRMEYFENGGGATAQLRWSAPSFAKEIIPETNLKPPGAAVAPFVVSPANATLVAAVQPPACYAGSLTAAWGLDKLDRATVSGGGVVTVQSPVAGLINVTAYVQNFTASGTVNVVVNATDVLQAPAGSVAIFNGAAVGNDTTTILYPYDATVYPLALKPPVLQWDPGANTATSVKVSLVYPAAGTPTFSWSKIVASPTNNRFAFTREQWGYFERSAKGGTGKIVLQRIVGGVLKNSISKTITFSNAPLRGKIFYTQYGGGSKIMRLDPGGDNAAVNAFSTDTGCPVCHSMSANGNKFATSDRGFSANGGISNVDAAGNLTVLSDFPSPNAPYGDGGNDWRGFAWAPFTPDGKYIFATNNIYGNTRQAVVGINTTTRAVELPAAMVSGGRGTGLQADYYSTNDWTGSSWRRIDAHPDFYWTASPGGPIPANAFSAVWNGSVEGYFTESHTFEVQTTVGVRLTVGGTVLFDKLTNSGAATYTGTANLTKGAQTTIKLELQDKNGQDPKVQLYWSSTSLAKQLIPQSQLFPANGQRGALVVYTDPAGHTITRLESDMAYDWGSGQPAKGTSVAAQNIDADFSSSWDALVEAPVTGTATWCINSDEGYTVKVGATTVLGPTASSTSNAYVCGATTTAVTAGTKYAVHVDHKDTSGDARMKLAWKFNTFITTTEDIPSARIYPPASWAVPTSGLSASFYDTMDFGLSPPQNASTPQAFATYVPNLDWDWGGDRFAYGKAMTDADSISGRFTGRLQPACTGVHQFEVYADDTTNIWIGGERLISTDSWGTRYAARWLDSSLLYDFKVDWTENGGGAGIRLKWKPACNAAASYTVIPTANFKPTGDTTLNGYIRQGGDNGNGYSYVAWQTPDTVGAAPVDVTSQSPGNWGLGQSVMMVPAFSPDAKKLVFVDGDSATNAGWRKGLSTFDFDQTNKLFKNRRQMVNNFPYGDVIKWPTYESDSKSVIYQTTTPGDMCCRKPWTLYGYMGPTNYFEDPGRLWSIDTSAASPAPVLLSKLNDGERTVDKNKSYQATMLPNPTGGYRWAVFTSTRPYGNTINLPAVQQDYSNVNSYTAMTNTSELQSMLWVSAIDDTVSANTDRSHPAFFLPNQAYSESGSSILNERAYWVTEACRAAGNTAASACDVDEDCCGGTAMPKTGVCRIDTPITSPPTRHCATVPPANACFAEGAACTQTSDCCFGNPCVANVCTKPPALPAYYADNFVRMYTSECGKGTFPVWRFFDWKAETPNSTTLEIYAESVDDPATFHTVPIAPTAVAITGVVKIATISGATIAGWVGEDVGAKLKAAGYPQRKYVMITIRFIPNATNTATPKLSDWRQAYSCPPAE